MHFINALSVCIYECVCVDIVNLPPVCLSVFKSSAGILAAQCMQSKHRMHMDQHTRTAFSFVAYLLLCCANQTRTEWTGSKQYSRFDLSLLSFPPPSFILTTAAFRDQLIAFSPAKRPASSYSDPRT